MAFIGISLPFRMIYKSLRGVTVCFTDWSENYKSFYKRNSIVHLLRGVSFTISEKSFCSLTHHISSTGRFVTQYVLPTVFFHTDDGSENWNVLATAEPKNVKSHTTVTHFRKPAFVQVCTSFNSYHDWPVRSTVGMRIK